MVTPHQREPLRRHQFFLCGGLRSGQRRSRQPTVVDDYHLLHMLVCVLRRILKADEGIKDDELDIPLEIEFHQFGGRHIRCAWPRYTNASIFFR